MDFSGAIFNGLLTIAGYSVIFLGVYKVFQIASDIREMKQLMAITRRAPAEITPLGAGAGPALAREATRDLIAEDSAGEYAEHLLRSLRSPARQGRD